MRDWFGFNKKGRMPMGKFDTFFLDVANRNDVCMMLRYKSAVYTEYYEKVPNSIFVEKSLFHRNGLRKLRRIFEF